MPKSHPNILVVFPDQLGASWLNVYGNSDVITPAIDAFAAESTVFDRAYTASPLCTPARGALLTGRYPEQTGITRNGASIASVETTLPALLRDAGYYTAHLGKWHLSGKPAGDRWVQPEARAGYERFIGWECLHVDHWRGLIWDESATEPIVLRGHETDALTDIVCDELDRIPGDRPFFMKVSYQAPHEPCTPPYQHMAPYRDATLKGRANTDWQARLSPGYCGRAWAEHDTRAFMQHYFGEISQLDAAFGRVLQHLNDRNLTQDTIVILTSDHGEHCGSHGRFGKQTPREESLHVPLIIRIPGQTSRRTPAFCSTVDLMPTILGLCGVPVPDELPGFDYSKLLHGGSSPERQAVVTQLDGWYCLRHGALKLTCAETGPTELFDLEQDPYELNNQIDHPARANEIEQMTRKLAQIRSSWR